jgi:two-component system sensor histidine kinase TctE
MSLFHPRQAHAAASLRTRLLGWILLPLAGLIGINAWVGYGNAVQAANEAYDRSLYLAARTLAEELEWRDGRVQLDVMKAAGYLFENHTVRRWAIPEPARAAGTADARHGRRRPD